MSDYKAHDFYDSEAVRQVETTNALQSHLELKYKQFRTYVESLPEGENEQALATLRGYKLALDDLTHSSGTTLAHLYGEQKWGPREDTKPEVVDDPAYEYALSAYDDAVPVFMRERLSEILEVQRRWRECHEGANTLFRRLRAKNLTPEAFAQQFEFGKDYREKTTIEAGPWEKL